MHSNSDLTVNARCIVVMKLRGLTGPPLTVHRKGSLAYAATWRIDNMFSYEPLTASLEINVGNEQLRCVLTIRAGVLPVLCQQISSKCSHKQYQATTDEVHEDADVAGHEKQELWRVDTFNQTQHCRCYGEGELCSSAQAFEWQNRAEESSLRGSRWLSICCFRECLHIASLVIQPVRHCLHVLTILCKPGLAKEVVYDTLY